MRASQVIVFSVLFLGIFAHLELENSLSDIAELKAPIPCQGSDVGSSSGYGSGSCSSNLKSAIRVLDLESSIENIKSQTAILSFESLANHVVASSKKALGFQAVLSEETLASMAWTFRLRYSPAPVVVAEKSTKGDWARLVRHVLLNHDTRRAHHFSEKKILELIEAVRASVEVSTGFVYRIIEGDDNEFREVHLHQLSVRQHYFAAVHTSTDLYVSFVSSEVLGEFIKGHGGADAVNERAGAEDFLRQWLLNQWVNLWICTNPVSTN